MNKTYIITGATFICLAIVLGAFGAHSLKTLLNPSEVLSFEVGVRYQMYQGIALLALGLNNNESLKNKLQYRGFTLGTLLFSGSIYFLSIDRAIGMKLSWFGPLTPVGGAILIVTWIYFIYRILKRKD
ncbi:MAG: DUF423 domain-containing protein [Crocinitomicaceae bacterium]|tara:strand:- start:1369 stop:1752 length:384 start_codon:yes stop_codon:yes gene_type:complete